MSTSLDNLKTRFQLLIADKSNGTIESGDQTILFNQAIRILQTTADVYGTQLDTDLDIFAAEKEYPVPSKFKATIDLLDRDNPVPHFRSRSAKVFWRDRLIETDIVSQEFRRETQFLLVNSERGAGSVQVNNFDSVTADGTWAAVGGTGVSNVTADTSVKKEGEASINFDVTAGTVPAIENSTFTAIDLSAHEDKSTLFLWVFLPTISDITSVNLRWGSTTSDYWDVTETDQFSGQDFVVGWNRLGFAWNGASETGTPVASGIDMVRVTINYSVAVTDTDFRVDDLTSKLPLTMTHFYYTTPMTKTTGGVYNDEFTAGDDVTVMLDSHDDLLVYKALEFGFMVLQEFNSAGFYRERYEEHLRQIMQDFNSQRERETDFYYRQITRRSIDGTSRVR